MASSPVMRWLAEGVPLTLLCDLVASRDPESQAINLAERPLWDLSDPLVAIAAAPVARSRAIAG